MITLPPLVAAVVSAFPDTSMPTLATHDEIVAWMRTRDGLDVRIVDFLADREDCAGATPADWERVARMGKAPWFKTLPGPQRNAVLVGIVGVEGANALMDWAVAKTMPRASRAVRRARAAKAA